MYFQLTKKAVNDLRKIGRYTLKNWGRSQRNIYLKKLDDGFHTIAREPQISVSCDDIKKGYRKFHVGRHLIFYLVYETHIDIIRILHEKMDVSTHLK
jgi:toxin ParE1/3/4